MILTAMMRRTVDGDGRRFAFLELPRPLCIDNPNQRAVGFPQIDFGDELRENVRGLGLRMAIHQLVVASHEQLVKADNGNAMNAMDVTQLLRFARPYDLGG